MSDADRLAQQTTFNEPASSDQVLRLHAEEAVISRRRVEGDTVRVSTVVREHEECIEEELKHHRVEVHRVAIGRVVEAAPAIREDGDVTIIPVMVEEVVVQRRLVLKEEIHVRRRIAPELHKQTIVLRREEISITRSPAAEAVI